MMKRSVLAHLSLVAVAALAIASAAHASLVVEWNVNGEPLGTTYGSDAGITGTAGTASPHTVFVPATGSGVTTASVVAITNTGAKPAGYTQVVDNAFNTGFSGSTWQAQYNDADKKTATFDLFVSPDSLTGGGQLLFETGGNGSGMGIGLINNVLAVGADTKTASVDLSAIYDASPNFNDFIWVRAILDLENDQLTINALNFGTGLSVSASNNTFTTTDWAGTDPAGLLKVSGTVRTSLSDLLPSQNPADWKGFDGQFAALRYYNEALPLVAIPEPATLALIACGSLLCLPRRRA